MGKRVRRSIRSSIGILWILARRKHSYRMTMNGKQRWHAYGRAQYEKERVCCDFYLPEPARQASKLQKYLRAHPLSHQYKFLFLSLARSFSIHGRSRKTSVPSRSADYLFNESCFISLANYDVRGLLLLLLLLPARDFQTKKY